MKVLAVEKANGVNVKDINGLKEMQDIVDGHIESVHFV